MPKLPDKICKFPGCKTRTVNRAVYCELHTKQKRKSHDSTRPSAWKRGYNTRHRKLREVYLANNPFCEECARNNRVSEARVLDHIIPLSQGGAPYDTDNLQALCVKCHNQKTARERVENNGGPTE